MFFVPEGGLLGSIEHHHPRIHMKATCLLVQALATGGRHSQIPSPPVCEIFRSRIVTCSHPCSD